MIAQDIISESWKNVLSEISKEAFKYQMVKPLPSVWVEENMILPDSASRYPGRYSYDRTPWWREIIDHLAPNSPVRFVSIMKSAQNGATAGVIIPGILYIIAVDPDNTLFTAGDLMLAKKTIEERLDTILRESKLDSLIRPHAVKKGNQRSGDTAASKEFAGGTLTALGTGSANSFRFFSAKNSFVDDFDTAPRNLGGEGSVKSLIKGRQNSFGNSAKTFFVSTPTKTATSNIYEQVKLGTQKKWHWPCWSCGEYMPIDWKIECADGELAGMTWKLTEKNRLIKESVAFKCPHCKALTLEKDKYELNKLGTWVKGVEEPEEEQHESYMLNAIFQTPGFTGWVELVQEFLQASPPGQKANITLLTAFLNTRLGLPFEELGSAPKANALMNNIRKYLPGIVPNKTCEEDGNGKIMMVTIACDLNGIMNEEMQDIRLDWEIVAHSQTGPTYSIDQGSIGTFKRSHERTKEDKAKEDDRIRWTVAQGHKNNVFDVFEEKIKAVYQSETDAEYSISITAVDTGAFEKHVSLFILKMQEEGLRVYGVKGRVDQKYRPLQRDTKPVKHSTEKPKQLYIVEVDQMKDDLAQNMALQEGDGGGQPAGFMNFPQQNDGKYSYKDYFSHFEGERRVEEKNSDGAVIGSKWVKKNSGSANHFWDVRIYNLVAPLIYLDLVRKSKSEYSQLSWEEFVLMCVS